MRPMHSVVTTFMILMGLATRLAAQEWRSDSLAPGVSMKVPAEWQFSPAKGMRAGVYAITVDDQALELVIFILVSVARAQ